MKTTLLILALGAFALASTLRAEETTRPPINPALLYWQAAAVLPKLTDDQAKDLGAMASGKIPFDAAKAQGLLTSESSLRLMQKAANSTAPCDWGLPTEDGPEMALPHTSKMLEMASLAILGAETSFASGKTKEGLDWLLTTQRMARHAGAGDLLISNLVQFAIETNAIRAAARHCLSWDPETRQSYTAMLQTLPPLHTTQAAYRGEHWLIDWVERKFTEPAESKADGEKFLQSIVAGGSKPEDKEALAAELAPGAIQAALAELRSLQSRTEAAAGKPWSKAEPELKALDEEAARSSHFLVRASYPTPASVAAKQYAIATMRTMLDAALQHGPQLDAAAAATYHDSFDGEPLLLKKAGDGALTLFASHQHPAGKDLSLQLGK